MKIRIVIFSPTKEWSVMADEKTGEFRIGFKRIEKGLNDFVRDSINIVKEWPDELEDLSVLDGTKYRIAYDDGNTCRQLIGVNKLPDNFYKLRELIESYENQFNRMDNQL